MIIVRGDQKDLRVFFDRHNGRLNVTFNAVADALKDWNIWRLEDDKPIAVIVEKNGAAHISAYGNAKVGIAHMKNAIEVLKICRTSVSDGFMAGHALAKRLGFHVEMTEKGVTHYVRSF